MKKTVMLLAGFLIGAFSLAWSQTDANLIVLECQGKVRYYAPDKKPVNVISGLVIDPAGTLKMKKGSRIKVLRGMKTAVVEQAGKFVVQDALPEAASGMRLGFSNDFYHMVRTTIASAGSPPGALIGRKGAGGEETPPSTSSAKKGAGGEDMPPSTSSTKKGAGGEETPPSTSSTKKGAGGESTPPSTSSGKKGMGLGEPMLTWNFPMKGNLHASGPIVFSWEGYEEGEGPWLFSIQEAGSRDNHFEKETTDPYIALTAVQARISAGKSYTWRVSYAAMPKTTLRAFEFTLVQEQAETGILDALLLEEDYQKAGQVHKLLWEAYAYEVAKYYPKADRLYKQAIALDSDNWLAVQLYRGFWSRNW